MALNVTQAEFLLSAFSPEQFIHDDRPKFVFAGRSNVGKSSVINCLLGRKQLAKVGHTPGKTRAVNYFAVGDVCLVDLPGYGYANVSHTEKARWADLMERFFEDMRAITKGYMIVDARHKPTAQDITMASYFQMTMVPYAVIANKIDKLKPSEIPSHCQRIRETLVLPEPPIPFSAEKKAGRDAVLSDMEKALHDS